MDRPIIKMSAFTLDCKEPYELAEFYAKLLGWVIPTRKYENAGLVPPDSKHGAYPYLLFQRNPDYEPPVWPDTPGAQRQMAHVDFAVADVEEAVAYAITCGATLAPEQFSDSWRVMFDPAGHPFCLCDAKAIIESPDFALL